MYLFVKLRKNSRIRAINSHVLNLAECFKVVFLIFTDHDMVWMFCPYFLCHVAIHCVDNIVCDAIEWIDVVYTNGVISISDMLARVKDTVGIFITVHMKKFLICIQYHVWNMTKLVSIWMKFEWNDVTFLQMKFLKRPPLLWKWMKRFFFLKLHFSVLLSQIC